MTHWDGLASSTKQAGNQRICILGATNRIQDIDEAILRRMPKKFPVSLPNSSQRRQIFGITLAETKLDKSSTEDGRLAFDMSALVRASAGMSGSDIKEACRDAAMVPVREHIRNMKKSGENVRGIRSEAVRGLQTEDFFGQRGAQKVYMKQAVKEAIRSRDEVGSDGSGSTEEVEEFEEAGDARA
jgi:SpoVK/Ycf46/Vps4 family AAA+-type ATPase